MGFRANGRKAFHCVLGVCCALAMVSCSSTRDAGNAETASTPVPAPELRNVQFSTSDGMGDALLLTPQGEGSWPAVILWPDLTGLRPVFADMARDLASEGYVVLVPNAFYRSVKLDGSAETAQPIVPFGELFRRAAPWREAASDEAVGVDTRSLVALLDTLPQVDKARPMGAVGVNIGAAHAFIAARTVPDRFGAVAAIHPMAIATTRDTSPHLFVDQSKAAYLVEIAQPDDEREPNDKDDLRAAFAAAGLPATVEVVPAAGGFMVADDTGYDEMAAQQVWAKVLALLRKRLN